MDTGLVDHPKMADLSSDAARWGWMVSLLKAKRQKTPGSFASPNHYRHVLGKLGRYLQEYVDAGLLDEVDGRLDIHDWPDYQRDRTNAERQQRFREKGVSESLPSRSSNGTNNEPRASAGVVAVAVDVVSTEGVQGEPDAAVAFQQRTGQFPGTTMLRWLNELSGSHGEQRLVDMIGRTPMSGTDVSTYLRSVRDSLRAEDHKAERQEKADEARRIEAKRAPLRALPPADDISEAEAKRLAAEYMAQAKR